MDSLATFERELLTALADRLHKAPPPDRSNSLASIDGSLLSSAWQKAIRRGDAHLAKRCAWEMHERDPEHVWRRLRIVALEDTSVGDTELVATVLAVSGKRALHRALGAQRLLALITEELANAPKSRTACDLVVALPPARVPVEQWMGLKELTEFNREAMLLRASAWRNTTSYSSHEGGYWHTVSHGNRGLRDRYLDEMEAPLSVRFVATRGSGTEALNVLLAMAHQLKSLGTESVIRDRVPSPSWNRIGELPAYAFCMYSAPGRVVLGQLLKHTPWGQRLKQLSVHQPVKALGHLLFYVEGDYLANPLHVRHSVQIREWSQEVSLGRFGFPVEALPELKAQMVRDLPQLNAFRRAVKVNR